MRIREKIIAYRRFFHQYPELGWTEYKTTYEIAKRMCAWGYDITMGQKLYKKKNRLGLPSEEEQKKSKLRAIEEGVPKEAILLMDGGFTGLVAEKVFSDGPLTVLRFDIDGLCLQESENLQHFPYYEGFSSRHEGCMHACGHDGHIAIGLALAEYMSTHSELFTGKVRFLFQPAEEGARGASALKDAGWVSDADFFFGGHIGLNAFSLGEIAVVKSFLNTSKIDITFTGKAAHAGNAPQEGKNAMLAAASFVLHANGISRNSEGATFINIGVMESGSSRNIVADHAYLQLETRGASEELNQYMRQEVQRMAEASGMMYDVDVKTELVGEACGEGSSPDLLPFVKKAVEHMGMRETLFREKSFGASEDVSILLKEVKSRGKKGAYFLFGTPIQSGHHHPAFDFEERVLIIAFSFYVSLLTQGRFQPENNL